jgi:RNA polymerase sigma factor (sigma-70 family)
VTTPTPPPGRASLDERSWGDLLDFLDPERHGKQGPDRDGVARARCLEIVRKLVFFFAGRACGDAEDLAMETVLRVAAKCGGVDGSHYDDRIGYFYGVGRNVLHEWRRNSLRESTKREALRTELRRLPLPDPHSWSRKEALHRCLDECMAKLGPRARRLILSYYGEEKAAKIESRRRLAGELGGSVNALRIEAHRIRTTLRQCVFECLQPEAANPEPAPANG